MSRLSNVSTLNGIARTAAAGSLGVLSLLTICGCKLLAAPNEQDTPQESRIIKITKNDPELAKASAEARKTFNIFKESFEKNKSYKSATFSVKFPVTEKDVTEFFWLQVSGIEGNKIAGTHDCDGVDILSVHPGVPATIMADKINDWLLYDGTASKGGFSILAICKRSLEQMNRIDTSTPATEAAAKQELLKHWKTLERQAKANEALNASASDQATLTQILLVERLYKGNHGVDASTKQVADICGLPPEMVQAVNNVCELRKSGASR